MHALMRYFRILTVMVICFMAMFGKAVAQQSVNPTELNAKPPKGAKFDTIKVVSCKPKDLLKVMIGDMDLLLIDVRSPAEYKSGYIQGAVNIPMDQFESKIDSLKKNSDRNIVVVCKNGVRSMQACGLMKAKQFKYVFYLRGGIDGWVAENHQLVRK